MTSLLLSIIISFILSKLLDLKHNVNVISACEARINSALDLTAFEVRLHFWRRKAGWQKFQGIADEKLSDRSGGLGSLV